MHDVASNIASKIFYLLIAAEIKRIGGANNTNSTLHNSFKTIL